MQAILEAPTSLSPPVSEADAHQAARSYVAHHIDPALRISERAAYRRAQQRWLLLIRAQQRALHPIEVEAQTGKVVPLTTAQIRLVRERATIAEAQSRQMLPVDECGHVLAEYARQRASGYLDATFSMYFTAMDPVFVPGEPPCWQVTILFQKYAIGPVMLGVLDVNAHTGEPVPLPEQTIHHICERARAIVRHQTPTTNSG
jgi:hypothetical protein